MRKSNYDKMPATVVDGTLLERLGIDTEAIGGDTCRNEWITSLGGGMLPRGSSRGVDALNCKHSRPIVFINTRDLFKSAEDIEAMTYPYLTDDRLFWPPGSFLLYGFSWMRRR